MKCCFFWFLISTVLRPRESLLLENVPYCDEPRKKSWQTTRWPLRWGKKQVYFNSVTSTSLRDRMKEVDFHRNMEHSNKSFAFVNGSHVWQFLNTFIKCNICFYIWFHYFCLILTVYLWIINKMFISFSVRAVCFHFTVKSWSNSWTVCIHLQSIISPPQEI